MSQSLKASGVELDFRPGHNLRRNLPMVDGAKYNHENLMELSWKMSILNLIGELDKLLKHP